MKLPYRIKPSIYLKYAYPSMLILALGLAAGACGRSEIKGAAFIAPPRGFIVGQSHHVRESMRARLGSKLTILAWLDADASPTRDYLRLLAQSAEQSGLSVLTRDPSKEADSKISVSDADYSRLFEPYFPTLSILGPNGEVTFSSSRLLSPDDLRQLVEKGLDHTINYEYTEIPIEHLSPGQRMPNAKGTRLLKNGQVGPEAKIALGDAMIVYLTPSLKSCQVKSALDAIVTHYNATDHPGVGRVVVLVPPLHDYQTLRDYASELPETYLVTDSTGLFDPKGTRFRPIRRTEVGLIRTEPDGVIRRTRVLSGQELDDLFGGPFNG